MPRNENEPTPRKRVEKRTLGAWGLTAATAILGLASLQQSFDLINFKRQGDAVWNTNVPAEQIQIWISETSKIGISEEHRKMGLSIFLMFGTWMSAKAANKLEQNKR